MFEVRALKVKSGRWTNTQSGYFTEPAKAIEAMQLSGVFEGAQGVYFTLNPVDSALQARRNNRMAELRDKDDAATVDKDVIKLRWLMVDLDPERVSGVCSTDEEHEASVVVAREVAAFLKDQAWGSPIVVDSGNGTHLYYPVDLPTDQASALKRVLDALDFKFSSPTVKIDPTTYKPAQLARLAGSVNRKGDTTADRPHRPVRFLSAPESPRARLVTLEQLEAVAALRPADPEPVAAKSNGRVFDLGEWMARHLPDARGPVAWGQGSKWILPSCPWNPEHRHTAYVIQQPSGAIGAGCLKSSCDHSWRDLRDLLDPAHSSSSHRENGDKDVTSSQAKPVEATPWGGVIPLAPSTGPNYPTDAMPSVLCRFIELQAQALQVPEGLLAAQVDAVVAAAVQGKFRVRINSEWDEPLNTYVVVAMESGERKSPAQRAATAPLEEFERDLVEKAKPTIARAHKSQLPASRGASGHC